MIAEETGEVVWFMIEEEGRGVNLYKSLGDNAVQTYGRLGKRVPLHNTGAGKAILSMHDEEWIRWMVDRHGLEEHTENTITDVETLFDEITSIREQGYAYCDKETLPGVRSVGVPIELDDDRAAGISVGGPANRLQSTFYEQEIPDLLLEHANELELKFRYQRDDGV